MRNLLDPDVKMDEAFLKEQDRRRRERLPDQIYDVTTLLFMNAVLLGPGH